MDSSGKPDLPTAANLHFLRNRREGEPRKARGRVYPPQGGRTGERSDDGGDAVPRPLEVGGKAAPIDRQLRTVGRKAEGHPALRGSL